MAKVSLRQLKEKATMVNTLVQHVRNQLPDNEYAEDLDNNYYELWSMIIDVIETLDVVISDVEK
jgi:hypothetical protein